MADTIANWVTALAAVAALIAAVWAGRAAWQVHDLEAKRELDRCKREEQSQAASIASWVSWANQPAVATRLPGGGTSPAHLAVQNVSAVPVYNVNVTYSFEEENLGEQQIFLLSPTGLTPHHRRIRCEKVVALLAKPRDADERIDIQVSLSFTDAQGATWERGPTGLLS